MMPTRNKNLILRTLLVLALVSTSYLAFTSTDIPVISKFNDKIEHIAAFLVLSLLVDLSWPAIAFVPIKLPGLLAYGALIEVVQYFLPRRSASLLDLTADAVGILLYLLAAAPVARRLGLFAGRSGT